MNAYTIYHPMNGELNPNCETKDVQYESVHLLQTTDLKNVFALTQNDFSAEYKKLGLRSTSVGDIILDIYEDRLYFITSTGYSLIPDGLLDGLKSQVFILQLLNNEQRKKDEENVCINKQNELSEEGEEYWNNIATLEERQRQIEEDALRELWWEHP